MALLAPVHSTAAPSAPAVVLAPAPAALRVQRLALAAAVWGSAVFVAEQVARVVLPTALLDEWFAAASLGTLGLAVASAAAAWLSRRDDAGLLLGATLAPIVLVLGMLSGQVLGLLDLATLRDVAEGGLGLLELGALVFAAAASSIHREAGARREPIAALFAYVVDVTAFVVFAAALSGINVRAVGASWACDGSIVCRLGIDALSDLQAFHRLLAYVAVGLVGWLAIEALRSQRDRPLVVGLGLAAAGAIVVQAGIGLAAVMLGVPPVGQALHAIGSVAAWLAIAALVAAAHRSVPRQAPAPRVGRATGVPSAATGVAPSAAASGAGPARLASRTGAAVQVPSGAAGASVAAAAGRAPGRGGSVEAGELAVPRGLLGVARAYVQLTKPGVMSLLLATTVAAMVVAARGMPPLGLLLATLAGGALMSGGAGAINHYVDRDIDPLMGRTAWRPIPSGVIAPARALWFGIILAVLASAVLLVFVNPLATLLALIGLLGYVFIYTLWLKRSTPSNIVIGGAAGAIPPLVGWAAVTNEVSSLTAWYLFAVIFFWTPPHFWALSLLIRQHYERAGVPMLPVVRGDDETRRQIVLYACLLVALTLVLSPLGLMGLVYFASALALGGLLIVYAVRLLREATRPAARRLYLYSILYLFALFLAMAVDRSL